MRLYSSRSLLAKKSFLMSAAPANLLSCLMQMPHMQPSRCWKFNNSHIKEHFSRLLASFVWTHDCIQFFHVSASKWIKIWSICRIIRSLTRIVLSLKSPWSWWQHENIVLRSFFCPFCNRKKIFLSSFDRQQKRRQWDQFVWWLNAHVSLYYSSRMSFHFAGGWQRKLDAFNDLTTFFNWAS